ncbi:MAG: putative LPS assembly protein LptD [Bacteroidota bacterium]
MRTLWQHIILRVVQPKYWALLPAGLLFLGTLYLPNDTRAISTEIHVIPLQPDTTRADTTRPTDSLRVRPDTTRADTTVPARQLQPGTPQPASSPSGEGQQAVQFQASDSLTFSFEGTRSGMLFGSAKVTHPTGELSAGKISMNIDSSLVRAATRTPGDTLSQPVLQREDNRVRSQRILFNYETEKGKFDVARVKVQQGNLIGDKVKKTDDRVVFVEEGKYSTCPLDHPHYYIQADRMKVVDEEEIFFTNAKLFILDIPYPMIFPFGYVPAKFDRKQSGIMEPTYAFQNKQNRGLGLQNLGWFQYFNDYITGQASFDIFTSGTYYINARGNYKYRDDLQGSLTISYSRDQGMEPTDPDFLASKSIQKRFQFNHQQTISPYAKVNADINYITRNFYRQNSYDIDDRAKRSTSSKVNYSYRHPDQLFNFNISAQQSQTFTNNQTTLTGPNMRFSLKTLTPFQQGNQRGGQDQTSILESISINYSNQFQSRYEFTPIAADSATISWYDALLDPQLYEEATGNEDYIRAGFSHDLSMNARLLPSRYINLTGSVQYDEYWYPSTIRKTYVDSTQSVQTNIERGFAATRSFSTGLNLSTTLYGIMNRKIGKLEGFRHTLRPSINFSYKPDFSDPHWGVYRAIENDPENRTYSIYERGVLGAPRAGRQQSLGFQLSNVFETKLVRRDSTGERSEETLRLIDNFNLSSSYNFAAESFKLSDLQVNFSSSVIPDINFNARASYSFYDTNDEGQRIDEYLWNTRDKLARLTSFNLSASTQFSGGQGGGIRTSEPKYPAHYDPLDQSIFRPISPHFNRNPIQPVNVPWSFSLSFSYSWNKAGGGNVNRRATLNARNISFNLTPKWRASTSLGYDFIGKELTPSQFNLSRNLHCWNLSFQMNPFGEFQYYLFTLSVNDGQLQSLFQKLPILKNLERSSSPINRRR